MRDSVPAYVTDTLTQHDTNGVVNPITGDVEATRAIYVAVAGAISVQYSDGSTDDFSALGIGWHPLRISHLRDTNTDAGVEVHGAW
jgi:hypothetical protein